MNARMIEKWEEIKYSRAILLLLWQNRDMSQPAPTPFSRIHQQKLEPGGCGIQTLPRCLKEPLLTAHLVEHVAGQCHHGQVVGEQQSPQLQPPLHAGWPQCHQQEVEGEDQGDRNWGVDQWPRVCPWIWEAKHTATAGASTRHRADIFNCI